MKLSHMILLSIASLAVFYIQLWDDSIVTPMYLSVLGVCAAYGVYIKNVNITHIAAFIFVVTGISHIIFETGLINEATPDDNPLLQSVSIYGSQFLSCLSLALILIFRVQISRIISKSKNVKLTHFDGIFHWIFLYMAVINLLALLEDIAYILFDIKSLTLIYDNFEGLIYIAWAVCCGALLTMMIVEAKTNHSDKANAL